MGQMMRHVSVLYSDAHVVAVPILALVSNAGVELDHLIIAVQSHLVRAQLDRQLRGHADHQLAQLSASILVTDHHVLQPPHTAATVDELLLHHHGGGTDHSLVLQVLDDYDVVCS